MRNLLTTFAGVLLALLVYAGIRYVVRQDRQQQQENEKAKANDEYNELQSREDAARDSLKTADAELSPLNNDESMLWPPALEHHESWTLTALRKACGKPVQTASWTEYKMNFGRLYYKDASGNLVSFDIGANGVTVAYADPKHVINPDLIGSINSIACLSAVK